MVSTATKVGQFTFSNCLMNAAGVHCMTKGELAEVEASAAGSFVTKTGTLEARPGNPEPRYVNVPLGSINSMGLPNNGFEYYLDYVIELQKQPNTKNHFLSLVGLSPEETHTILKKVQDSDYEGLVELNLSCPNVPGKPQIAYDFETTTEILTEVFSYFTKPLGVKLPPYFDIVHFDQAAAVFNQFPLVFVNCVNSIGNGLYIEDESVVIKPKNGFGGIGGDYIKPTALANVHAFYQRLKPEIQIIGTGGVKSGRDAFEHILCGASMVQVGTAFKKKVSLFLTVLLKNLKKSWKKKVTKLLKTSEENFTTLTSLQKKFGRSSKLFYYLMRILLLDKTIIITFIPVFKRILALFLSLKTFLTSFFDLFFTWLHQFADSNNT